MSETTSNTAAQRAPANQQGGQGAEDYLDKGVDAVEKKYGMDPKAQRSTNEKATDAVRGGLEKLTGKDIPDKFSN